VPICRDGLRTDDQELSLGGEQRAQHLFEMAVHPKFRS